MRSTWALDVRLTSLLTERTSDGAVTAWVETKQNSYGVFLENGFSRLKKCGFYEDHGRIRYLDPSVRESLLTFAENAEANACRVLTVMRELNGQWALLAVLALREEVQAILPSVVEELERSGVRVYFCLREEDGFERGYADAAGLSDRRIFATDVRQNGGLLPDFLGFSAEEIATLVRTLRRSGRCVGVIGARADELPAMHAASVAIAAESIGQPSWRSHKGGDAERLHTSRDREDTLPEASVLHHADLLICRACRTGGGLATLLEMLSSFRAHRVRIPAAVRFLCTSQLSCLFLTLLSLCFGVGLMSGAQILYIGTVSELLLTAAILSLPIPQARLRRVSALDEKTLLPILKSRGVWLSPLISGAFAVIFVWILGLFELISPSAQTACLFCSMILLQITAFGLSLVRYRLRQGIRTTLILSAAILLPLVPCILLSMLWPSVDAVLMMGGWRWMTLVALPVPSLILLISAIFLERTAT